MSQPSVDLQGPSSDFALAEPRLAKRYPAYLRGLCHAVHLSPPGAWPVKVRDVSASGIGLLCSQGFQRGTLLRLEVENPAGRRLPPLHASVVWARPLEDGGWHLGCVLDRRLSDDELQPMIQEILSKRFSGDLSPEKG